MAETNRYAQQQLSQFPERLAKFEPVTRAELKAFMGINIIMGTVKLPDDAFANNAIKKTMSRNHFFEENGFLHFNDANQEPAHGEYGKTCLLQKVSLLNIVITRVLSLQEIVCSERAN